MEIQYNLVWKFSIIILFLENVFQLLYALSHRHGECDCLVVELYRGCLVLVNGKQHFFCEQLPNVMFLYIYTWL